jgi:hypothetical protein
MTRKRVGIVVGVLALTALLIMVVPAIGNPSTSKSGGAITKVKVLRETAAQTTTSTSFVNLPGASTTITVPAGQKALILARFSAESNCSGGTVDDWCSARIMVGGSEGGPASGSDFAFDSVDSSETAACAADECGWESHSMDRSRGPLGPGTYKVKVQWRVVQFGGSAPTFRLDDWSLIVERVKAG